MRLELEDLDLASAERKLLETALGATLSHQGAAALLRISVRELRIRMRRLGLSDRAQRAAAEAELDERYTLACRRMRAVHDMPDRLEQLFIRLCWGHPYSLPADRRDRFSMLSDDVVARLERAVREAFTWPLAILKEEDPWSR